MNCKFCDTPLLDAQTACPTCGHAVAGRPAAAPETPSFPKGKKQRTIFFCTLAVLLALLGVILWQSFKGGGPDAQLMQKEVVQCGDFALTNTELGYYFWSEYFYFIDSYGEYLPASLDTKKPLQDQMYDEQMTWYGYILARALETVRSTMAMVFEAEKAGFTLDETYEASLRQVLEKFSATAEGKGFVLDGKPDIQAYLADSYGVGASIESFEAYLRKSYLAAAYSDELYLSPTFTAQEISDYYDRFASTYAADGIAKDDVPLRTLRTVLIAPKNPEDIASWDAAEESAENLYAAWLAESGKENDFASLAIAHSADIETAGDGGLMTQVSRKALSGALAEWTFAAGRKPGDTAVVQSDGGWAIAYFVAVSDQSAWQKQALADLRTETYQNTFRTIAAQYEFMVDYKAIKIATPSGLYDGGTEKAAQTSASD